MTSTQDDSRFTVPMYSVTDAARYLHLPRQTLANWSEGALAGPRAGLNAGGDPLITVLPQPKHGYPRLPFVGLAEAYVLSAFRRSGVPLQRIRPTLDALHRHVGPHALASERLFTDGVEVLWDVGQQAGEGSPEQVGVTALVVPRSGQYVFTEVVAQYLQRIAFEGGYARLIGLPYYGRAAVVLDPRRGGGRPVFAKAGVTVDNVLGAIRGGDSVEAVAEDYGVAVDELSDALALSA